MQVKRPRIRPAIALIGRITREAMEIVLRELITHSATEWKVDRIGHNSRDGDYFVIAYRNYLDGRMWEMVFGFDGSLWMD